MSSSGRESFGAVPKASLPDARLEQERCFICGSAKRAALYCDVVRCETCGHGSAMIELSSEAASGIYGDRYFRGEEYFDYLADRKVSEFNFRNRLRVLRSFLDSSRHRSLLEVGCAFGFFLNLARPMFDSVEGIDIAEVAVRYASEHLSLKVTKTNDLGSVLEGRKFDVVCMWDTVEHLDHPERYIDELSQHMESGSILALTTGDFGSLNARIRRENWRLMHPPSHAHYFSKRSLDLLLEKFGFSVIHNRHCGYYRSLSSMVFGVCPQSRASRRVLDILRTSGIGSWPIYLNLYDIIYVVARKR